MNPSYQRTDLLSLAMHQHLFPRLQMHPEKLEDIKNRILYWIELGTISSSRIYLDEWLKAISEGISGVENIVFDMTDRGQVLRSCTPFGSLWESPCERWIFIKDFDKKYREMKKMQDAQEMKY